MRVVITGATGNVGTSLLRSLATEPEVDSILGLARRIPSAHFPKTTWQSVDVASSDLTAPLRGADAIVHLAWAIQPSRDMAQLQAINVDGSKRVFDAAAKCDVPVLVYASSIGAYSEGPKDRSVDESWPTDGIGTAFYSRHKAQVERMLDSFEREHPEIRVVRLRPGLIFKREAASEIRRLFAGPLLPNFVLRRKLVPLVPDIKGLRFQVVHSYDVGDAYRLSLVKEVRGAFNIAADPVLQITDVADLLGARPVTVPPNLLRGAASASWRLHLQPTPPGWFDMALSAPIMDTARARKELGWTPAHSAVDALADLLQGMGESAGAETPPLTTKAGGPLRFREFVSGVGRR